VTGVADQERNGQALVGVLVSRAGEALDGAGPFDGATAALDQACGLATTASSVVMIVSLVVGCDKTAS